ncbi:hypothetical protein FFIC_241110 [Fructobacillus ficulneus]|uniref:Uncharacterized protein n=1 Tax=Fructobacillus ficulneus TaxID=157463 RepID=A0A0K8MGZ4_9LACO|nr:hypothetical protein FFIC_241110 [Fructobacillus ficulneus]
MRYNQRLTFVRQEKGSLVHQPQIYPVNVTSLGFQAQNLVFGSAQRGSVAVRFQNKVDVRSGFFTVAGKNYEIKNSNYTDRSSTIYGVEYHGRL